MKMTKKIFLKKLLIYLLSVVLLSVSIGDMFISDDIGTVRAVAPTAIGLDVMYALCEYLGYTTLTYTCGKELPEISSDDAAKLGHDLMVAIYGTDSIFLPDAPIFQIPQPDGTIVVVTGDGQSYVFGTEALQETAATDFTVIQGGKNDGGDDDDDDDDDGNDNIIHFPKLATEAGKKAFAFTIGGALMFGELVSTVYHDWINGEENNLLDPVFEKYPDVTAGDIAEQWSGQVYSFDARLVRFPMTCGYCKQDKLTISYEFSENVSSPLAFCYTAPVSTSSNDGGYYTPII